MLGKHETRARNASRTPLERLLAVPSKLRKARRGNVAILVGLSMPAIVGASGVTMDVATWYHAKKEAQVAADAAAYAAALNLAEQGLDGTATKPPMEVRANDAAGRNGYTGTVVLNFPPSSGVAVGNNRAVEAILTEPAPLYFTSVFWNGAPNIQARAVAIAVVTDACVWALDPTERAALNVSGGANVDLDCGVVVNSNDPQAALNQSGNSCLVATSISVAGEYTGGCVTPEPERYTANYGNPLGGLPFPNAGDYGACLTNGKYNITATPPNPLVAGRYCGEISISGGTVTLEGGEYFIEGDLKVSGNASLIANGPVTIFYAGQVDIASGAIVTLDAITTGPYANMLFFQDPNISGNIKNKFSGGVSMNLTGIILAAGASVEFTGGSSLIESKVAIVANTVNFVGNTFVDGDYAASLLPETTYARLAE